MNQLFQASVYCLQRSFDDDDHVLCVSHIANIDTRVWSAWCMREWSVSGGGEQCMVTRLWYCPLWWCKYLPLSSNTRYCYKLQQQHHRCNSWTHTFTHFPVITSRNVKISQKYTSHSTLLCCAYNRALFVGEKLKSRLDFYLQLYLLVSPPITVYPGNNLDSFHQFFLCFVDLPSLGACSHDCYFELCHSWVVNMNLVLRLQYCY